MTIKHPILAAVAALTLAAAAHGQGIERKSEAFPLPQSLPLAAPSGESVPAAAQERAVAAVALAAPTPTVALEAGSPVGQQLTRLARASGWTLLWNASQDWMVPAAAVFEGNFDEAASQIINTLASNGADVRAEIYAGNKTIVVHAAGEHR